MSLCLRSPVLFCLGSEDKMPIGNTSSLSSMESLSHHDADTHVLPECMSLMVKAIRVTIPYVLKLCIRVMIIKCCIFLYLQDQLRKLSEHYL